MQKVENFQKALTNLKKINDYSEPYGTVELTGMVALFEICFEQAWKAMKALLENAGFDESRTGSPRQILKTAYSANMIQDEDSWLSVLEARNHAAHAYNEAIALDIVRRTKDVFIPLFEKLNSDIQANWLIT